MAHSVDTPPHERLGLSREQLLDAWSAMVRAREVDDRLWLLSRQGKVHFVITSAGHEATQVGCALAVRAGHDYVVPYYRDMALCMALGQTALDTLLHAMGRHADPSSGGRQMFGHFSSRRLRIVSGSSSVGSHLVHAVGLALAFRIKGESDIAAMTLFGEGATAEGAWHEALTIAGIHQLPVVFVCENNLYAMGTPLEVHSSVTEIYRKACAFDMASERVDGNDVLAMREAALKAVEHARSGKGPYFLEAMTYRFRGHSAQDTQKYRSKEDVEKYRASDPIERYRRYLLENGVFTEQDAAAIDAQVDEQVEAAVQFAEESPEPGQEWIRQSGVYAAPIEVNPPIHGE